MRYRSVALVFALAACGPSTPAEAPPAASAPASTATAPAPTATATATASATATVATAAAADASAPPAAELVTSVTAVSNDVTTPNVITPDKVIAGLRPQFNACYAEGLKKDPKLEGSVTLSAKIEKDGKVSSVTPKMLTGLSPAVMKCLTDKLKAASFASPGGINYTSSLDIPVAFSSR